MSSLRKSPSSKSRHSLVKTQDIPTSEARSRSSGRQLDRSDNSNISGGGHTGGGGTELESEIPTLSVSSVLGVDNFFGQEIQANVVNPKTKPSWAELYDLNNNFIVSDESPSQGQVNLDLIDSDLIDKDQPDSLNPIDDIEIEIQETVSANLASLSSSNLDSLRPVTLAGCPTVTVLHVGDGKPQYDTDGAFLNFYQDSLVDISKKLDPMTFPSSMKSRKGPFLLSSRFFQWEIVADSEPNLDLLGESGSRCEVLHVQESSQGIHDVGNEFTEEDIEDDLPPVIVANDFKDVEDEENNNEPETRWELKEAQDSRSRIPDRVGISNQSLRPGGNSSRLAIPQLTLQQQQSDSAFDPDLIKAFIRTFIPEDFETDIFSSAYNMGSKLINAGLQLAASFIGDESDLEPRVDVLKYNGYVIRTSGRGLLLQGIYVNCNLHQAHPDLRDGMEPEATSRLRIVVSLNPLTGEQGHHNRERRDPRVLIEDGKWTLQYGGLALEDGNNANVDEFEEQLGQDGLIDIEVPAGISPETIRYSGLADGVLIIEAP